MFISKEQKEKIELLNATLGTKHRSKPYDLLDAEDLIEAATYITAEYVDMIHYWSTVANVNSDFDESIEVFYPASWISISQDSTTHDEDINNARILLNKTEDAFYVLVERAEEKCSNIWKLILHSDFQRLYF